MEADGIVVVGVGCRFPGADNLDEFWRVLQNGENHVIEVPPDRWNADHYYDPDKNAPGKMYVRQAGFIPGFEEWDNGYFGISDEEAITMEPQQRIVLQCVDMAAQDGGFTRLDLQKGTTGVYIGSMTHDYNIQGTDDVLALGTYSVTGSHSSIISARVSYVYNLTGPALTIDTACSSSLEAIHLGSQALLTGDCDTAICGGVNYLLEPNLFVALSKARMLSPSGQCKAFTREADGYVRGEGCGIVILKRLQDAQRDGNKIWGMVMSGTNQDGQHAQPITKPAQDQQQKLIKQIITKFHIDKSKIQVIEAHGTGTPVGDPVECNALGTVLGSDDHRKFIGSVKTNIGHLEAAAGVAGLIKVLLMMKHRIVVPSLWYRPDNENPKLRLSEHGFVVPTKCEEWIPEDNYERLACVNSFGFGGTNVHVVVREIISDANSIKTFVSILPPIVAITARDHNTVRLNVQHLLRKLQTKEVDMQSLSYTTTCRRDIFQCREAFLAVDQAKLVKRLKQYLERKRISDVSSGKPKVVYVFCGVGTVWQDMGYSLLEDASFRNELEDIDHYLTPMTGWSIKTKFLEKSAEFLSDPCVSHIAIFCYQVALAAIWTRFGVTPDAVIGQSVGEVAAAYVAGFLNLASAVQVIYQRSKHLASVTTGKMIVVRNLDINTIEKHCQETKDIEIAVFNSKKSFTLSGCENVIAQFVEQIPNICPDAVVTPITASCAYHSSYVDFAAKMVQTTVGKLESQQKTIPMISTVTCEAVSKELICSPEYWQRNVRQPVRFADSVVNISDPSRKTVYLEIGPRPVLGPHLNNIFTEEKTAICVPSILKNQESSALGNAVCQLFNYGVDFIWNKLIPKSKCLSDLQFPQRRRNELLRVWKTTLRTQGRDIERELHPFVVPSKFGNDSWHVHLMQASTLFLTEHLVRGQIVVPGAFFSEIAFEIGKTFFGKNHSLKYIDVSLEFVRQVKVEKSNRDPLVVSIKAYAPKEVFFHINFGQNVVCKGWTRPVEISAEKILDVEKMKLSFVGHKVNALSRDELYDRLKAFGFEYGSDFRLLIGSLVTSQKSISTIKLTDNVQKQSGNLTLHPCLIDAMLQSTISMATDELLQAFTTEKLFFLPVSVGSIKVYRKPETTMTVFSYISNTTILETVRQLHYNIVLTDQKGNTIAEILNYTTFSKRGAASVPAELRYHIEWHAESSKHFGHKNPRVKKMILFCSNSHNSMVKKNLEERGHTFKELTAKEPIALQLKNAKMNEFDAVVILFYKPSHVDSPMSLEGKQLYNMMIENCMNVTEVIKYWHELNPIPIYIVTENTQSSMLSSPCEINVVGAELWGFVRSLNVESALYYITMIDTQPSIIDVLDRVVNFIEDASEGDLGHDTIVTPETLMCAHFSRIPRKLMTPGFRDFATSSIVKNDPLALQSTGPDMYLRKDGQTPSPPNDTFAFLEVQTAITFLFDQNKQTACRDFANDPYTLIALEHIGSVSTDESKFMKYVALFSSNVQTRLHVPKKCLVKVDDLCYFKPGLLTLVMLFGRFADIIKGASSVAVFCYDQPEWPHFLLREILSSSTSGKVSFVRQNDHAKVDCLVTYERIGERVPLVPSICRKLVCFKENLTPGERRALKTCHEFTLTYVELTKIFTVEHIAENLINTVEWINNSYPMVREVYEKHPLLRTQLSEIQLVDDLNSCYLYPQKKSLACLFDKQSVYVITGGLTGLGWEMTKLLTEMGAGTIVSITRSHASEDQMAERRGLEKKYNCSVLSVVADVSILSDLQTAFLEIDNLTKPAPIKGIFHGAGVVDGRSLINIHKNNFENVFRPKALGLLNLHEVTKQMQLDYFVVASSISAYVGMIGQGSYGAANCFMDAFMAWRRQQKLPGQTINWGALAVGMAARSKIRETFESRGYLLMSVAEIRSCFQEALLQNSTGTIYALVNWEKAAKDLINSPKTPFQITTLINETAPLVLAHKDQEDNITFSKLDKEALSSASLAEQLGTLEVLVTEVVKRVMGQAVENLNESFVNLGFDSMSQQQMINILDDFTSVRLPDTHLIDETDTVKKVIEYLHKQMFC
ncbi:phenolphthiocerol/phthiocerol polyketide synthase subunit C-like [Dreissena polymorpha]|uniref:Carrier domain-containing protein n=1 Tax=Dreissena polymorpha TaxID=45954 RepID=A0A9D4FY21_DREPO|nr:phenolphthiocerol/phthiocerol polyketide synthase subunit C-like [Dreissena polymorpha]KAH3806521.1 hypothetical protein DPMN_134844 [Dreissena polymorpha]